MISSVQRHSFEDRPRKVILKGVLCTLRCFWVMWTTARMIS